MCKFIIPFISLFVFASILNFYECGRILVVVPAPFISHQVVFRPLIRELARRGHEVTVLTADPAFPKEQTPANLTEIDLHEVSYKILREHSSQGTTGKRNDMTHQVEVVFDLLNVIFEKQIQTEQFQEILKKRKDYFDLLILELCVRQTLVLSHVFKAPVIQISSFGAMLGTYEAMGGPTHPLLYPISNQPRINNLNLWEKLTELYTRYLNTKIYENMESTENEMLRRNFGRDIPELRKLKENVEMVFLNMHPMFEGNFPVPPSVIHIWGIHDKAENDLPQQLKEYLDSSKHGVIYMSFGTNMDATLLPPEKIKIFIKVFSELPFNVLWKWDGDELPGCTENIKIAKWFPQSDLLRHPKIKLFVTQGGIHSTEEAIETAVPLVGIPMKGDQYYNVEKYKHLKIGVKLDIETISEEKFKAAIKTVIGDEGYRNNMVRLRTLMSDEPQKPLQRAVWWAEHVMHHGGAQHLRAPAANMHWTHYYEIELILTVLAVFILVLSLGTAMIYQFYRYVTNKIVNLKIKVKLSGC